MGLSISRETCVDLSHLPADQWKTLADEDITVIRTNGEHQTGWRFPRLKHYGACNASGYSWVTAHVGSTPVGDSDKKVMRFHMTCDSTPRDPNAHVCGWRKERTFWPTRLTGDEEAKKAWWDALDVMVKSLRIRAAIPAEELAVLDAAQDALDDALDNAAYAAERAERIAADRADDAREEAKRAAQIAPTYTGNFTDYIVKLEKTNGAHADRVRRLFDNGLSKAHVVEICQMPEDEGRDERLSAEERIFHLPPLADPARGY
jgi:hypothetical protein